MKREYICSSSDVNSQNKVVDCYVEGMAAYRPDNSEFLVEHILTLCCAVCTHIIYAFAGLDSVNHSIHSLYSGLDTEADGGFGK